MWQHHKTEEEKKERRNKYWLMRKLGYSRNISTRARDWRWTKIVNVIETKPEIIG